MLCRRCLLLAVCFVVLNFSDFILIYMLMIHRFSTVFIMLFSFLRFVSAAPAPSSQPSEVAPSNYTLSILCKLLGRGRPELTGAGWVWRMLAGWISRVLAPLLRFNGEATVSTFNTNNVRFSRTMSYCLNQLR